MDSLPPSPFASWRELMDLALTEAHAAGQRGEAPVGAVLISSTGCILGRAGNSCIGLNDPTAHAEILALRQAGQAARNYRLSGSILAVTLEPCLMCLGALIHARVGLLVFGARDAKAGAVLSRLNGAELPFLNHKIKIIEGVMAEDCGAALSRFFARRRKERGD